MQCPPYTPTVNRSRPRWPRPAYVSIQLGRTSNSWKPPASSLIRRIPTLYTQPSRSKWRTRKRPLWPESYWRHRSPSLASRDDANPGRFPPLPGSVQRASNGATPPTSAAPGPPHAINALAPISPPSTVNTSRLAANVLAPTLASVVPTAINSTPPQAWSAHSSEIVQTLASSQSSRRRGSSGSTAELNKPMHSFEGPHAPRSTREGGWRGGGAGEGHGVAGI